VTVRGIYDDDIDVGLISASTQREVLHTGRRRQHAVALVYPYTPVGILMQLVDVSHRDHCRRVVARDRSARAFPPSIGRESSPHHRVWFPFRRGDEIFPWSSRRRSCGCHPPENFRSRRRHDADEFWRMAIDMLGPHPFIRARRATAFDDGNAAHVVLPHDATRLSDRRAGRQRDRIDDHTVLGIASLSRLPTPASQSTCSCEQSNPALLRQRDSQRRLGHGIHRRLTEGHVDFDAAREFRMRIRVAGNEIASRGDQEHVIEGDGVVEDLGVFHVPLLKRIAAGWSSDTRKCH